MGIIEGTRIASTHVRKYSGRENFEGASRQRTRLQPRDVVAFFWNPRNHTIPGQYRLRPGRTGYSVQNTGFMSCRGWSCL